MSRPNVRDPLHTLISRFSPEPCAYTHLLYPTDVCALLDAEGRPHPHDVFLLFHTCHLYLAPMRLLLSAATWPNSARGDRDLRVRLRYALGIRIRAYT
jgi:hypothetical protein